MAINKVIYGADTLVDLTEDTVTAEDVLNGKSFHTPDGVKRNGTASYPVTDVQVNGESVLDGTVAKVEQPTAEEKSATDTFTTVNGGLLEECIIDLVPVQSGSGDPSPDNVRPISGHTEVEVKVDGKNYCSEIFDRGIYTNANFTLGSPNTIQKSYKAYLKAGTYTISFNLGTTKFRILRKLVDGGYDGTNVMDITSYTFTTTMDGYVGLSFRREDNTDWDDATKVQIEQGNQATAYEPYLGHLYTVQIGQTVYGGTVDLVSGVMKALWATMQKRLSDAGRRDPEGAGYTRYRIVLTEDINVTYRANTVCNKAPYLASGGESVHFSINSSGNYLYIYAPNDMATSEEFTFAYPINTATILNLTPQQIESLVGQNNLSTPLDGQSIQTDGVKYREVFVFDDVEKVVNLRVPISMLGTDESGRTTASQAYASGDYFYKDGYMCKALTSISAGATLTLNTNYSQGTLADVLKAIENA